MTKQNNFTECKCQWSINSSYFYSSGEILPLHSGFIFVLCPSKHLVTPAPLNTGNTANRKTKKIKQSNIINPLYCVYLYNGVYFQSIVHRNILEVDRARVQNRYCIYIWLIDYVWNHLRSFFHWLDFQDLSKELKYKNTC